MSDTPPPAVNANAALPGPEKMTPERLEAVLQDFRSWLAALPAAEVQQALTPDESIDLHTLLGQLLGLRHEVNLQTRAVRSQQEQNAQTIQQLIQALETLRDARASRPAAAPSSTEDAVRPLLKTLV